MNTMMHKGFAARVEYSEEDGCFVGHVAGIRDVIGFHGESIAKLRKVFREVSTCPAGSRLRPWRAYLNL